MRHPNWIRHLRPALAGAALLLLTTACAGYITPNGDGIVWVSIGPPAPQYEVRSASPGVDFIWIAGYNQWDGHAYGWTAGRWERRPEPRSQWVEGRWRHERRGWYFVPGHWQNGRGRGTRGNR